MPAARRSEDLARRHRRRRHERLRDGRDGWGADVAGSDRNGTPYAERVRAAGIPVDDLGRSRTLPRDGRSSSRARRLPGRSRAELLAELVSSRRVDRGVGDARQDDDGGDDRLLPRAARPRSGVPDRRRDPAARRKRRRREGVARRRGRRVRSHGRAPAARDRRRHKRRARPPHDVASQAEVEEIFERLARGRCRTRARLGARAGDVELAVPASTTGGTRLLPSPRSSSPVSSRARPTAAIAEFRGAGRRFEPGRGGRRRRARQLRPPSGRAWADARRCSRAGGRRAGRSSSRISTRGRATSRTVRRGARRRGRRLRHRDLCGPEEPLRG